METNAVAFQLVDSESRNVATNAVVDAVELPSQSAAHRPSARGYFGIGIENSKTAVNVGTLWRSANLYGAAFLFTVGKRYSKQCSDTMATERHIPLYSYETFSDLYLGLPYNCQLIGVELCDRSETLPTFQHPERAIYLLGAEDHGLSKAALERCHKVIQIPAVKEFSMNVAVAGSIVMYDRFTKCGKETSTVS